MQTAVSLSPSDRWWWHRDSTVWRCKALTSGPCRVRTRRAMHEIVTLSRDRHSAYIDSIGSLSPTLGFLGKW